MQQRLEAQIRQSLASLDRVVGTFTVSGNQTQRLPELVPPPVPGPQPQG